MSDLAYLTDDELQQRSLSGNISAELELRGRQLRITKTIIVVCLNCGNEIGRTHEYERRDTGERWLDPHAGPGIAMFTANHPLFCQRRGFLGWRRLRTAEYTA